MYCGGREKKASLQLRQYIHYKPMITEVISVACIVTGDHLQDCSAKDRIIEKAELLLPCILCGNFH